MSSSSLSRVRHDAEGENPRRGVRWCHPRPVARTLLVKALRLIFRHPLIAVFAAIGVSGVIVALGSGGGSTPITGASNRPPGKNTPSPQGPGSTGRRGTVPPTPAQTPPSLSPRQKSSFDKQKIHVAGGIPNVKLKNDENPSLPPPDPADTDPTVKAKAIQVQGMEPALQHLPLDRDGVTGNITDESPDGRLKITITYRGSRAHAEKVWKEFLKHYHDPGTAYLPLFLG